ncbi:hypothetical protein CFP56_040952 [Quercus suber]|uniref:Uncharacterized protein n=1 Tax=Quercus suber TaxID=58331 RepID=A0AAW0IWB0_QUESU
MLTLLRVALLSCPWKETHESIFLESIWQNTQKYSSTSFLTSYELTRTGWCSTFCYCGEAWSFHFFTVRVDWKC